ncbi:nicotinamidase-related amidase [Krasilnikovia cinnamomea]|uniref:Nicotinamidase-related amidase n=1 Tax=Krasilnikovia cinnamomea TaxID=349313 RepID=A0A4Q7ZEY5_9ACTN|nr:cysteine hydrolase [Krasilnikovia cinnamomea]RZU48854.1 nicotinamidase-related amidase [Krasilnikovia cinnamomea]
MPATKPVLVLVDVQNGFVREQSAHAVPVLVDLVTRWQAAGADTVFTRYFNYPGSPFERFFGWRQLQSSPEVDIVEALKPYAEKATAIVDKRIYSAFTPEFDDLVRSHGWTDVYACGIATESCVLKTAVDAFERDLTPWLIEDASASHAGPAAHEAGLLVARRFIGPGQVIKVAEVRQPGGEAASVPDTT